MVSRHLNFLGKMQPERIDDLVLDVIDHVAADRCAAFRRRDMHVERAFGMRVRRFENDAGDQLDRPREFEILEPQRLRRMQALDQVHHVRLGILRMHQA